MSERLERAISGLDYFLTNKAERRFIEGARNELAEMRPLLPITEIEREPAGWLVSFDGSVWEYCASDPEGFIGDRACIVRPIAFADGCNWGVLSSPAVQGEAAQQPPAPAAPGVPADAGREEQR